MERFGITGLALGACFIASAWGASPPKLPLPTDDGIAASLGGEDRGVGYDLEHVRKIQRKAESFHARVFGLYAGETDPDTLAFDVTGDRLALAAGFERGRTYWLPLGLKRDGVYVSGTAESVLYFAGTWRADSASITCDGSQWFACCECMDDGTAIARCLLVSDPPPVWSCQAGGMGASSCSISNCRKVDPVDPAESGPVAEH